MGLKRNLITSNHVYIYDWIHHGLVIIKFKLYPRKSVWLRCVEIQCHTSNTCSKWVQITTLFHLSRYYIRHCDNSGRKWNTFWNHNKHPISRPHGRAMGCLLWGFWRKLPASLWHRAVLFYIFVCGYRAFVYCMWAFGIVDYLRKQSLTNTVWKWQMIVTQRKSSIW